MRDGIRKTFEREFDSLPRHIIATQRIELGNQEKNLFRRII